MFVDMSVMVGVVMALSQLFKQTGLVASRFIPLVNLFVGIVVCLLYYQGDIKSAIMEGIIVGLTASGLFSSGKHALGLAEKEEKLD